MDAGVRASCLCYCSLMLQKLGKESWNKHFNCFHQFLFYSLMLCPLAIFSPFLGKLVTKVAGLSLITIGLLGYANSKFYYNTELMQFLVMGFGLFALLPKRKRCPRKCKRKNKTESDDEEKNEEENNNKMKADLSSSSKTVVSKKKNKKK